MKKIALAVILGLILAGAVLWIGLSGSCLLYTSRCV